MKIELSAMQKYAAILFLFAVMEIVLVSYVDRPVSEFLRTVEARHPAMIDVFRFYTDLGKAVWYLVPSGIAMFAYFGLAMRRHLSAMRRNKLIRTAQGWAFFFACVAVSGILTDIEKRLIGRARPILLLQNGYYGFDPFTFQSAHNSMPSGHATTAFAVACSLIVLFPRWKKWFLGFAIALFASRVMVNAHYLADACAGGFVGYLTVVVMHAIFERFEWYFLPPPQEPRTEEKLHTRNKG